MTKAGLTRRGTGRKGRGAGREAVSEEQKLRSTKERFSGRSGNLARHYSWQCFYQSRDNIRRVLSRVSKEESLLLSSTLTCSSLGQFLFPVSRASSSSSWLEIRAVRSRWKAPHGLHPRRYRMNAVPIDDMRSVTESRNRVGNGNSKEKWLRWNEASVGGAFVKNQSTRWSELGGVAGGGEGAGREWFYSHDSREMWVDATMRWLFPELTIKTPTSWFVEGIGESWRSFCGQCSRHDIGIAVEVFSMKFCRVSTTMREQRGETSIFSEI